MRACVCVCVCALTSSISAGLKAEVAWIQRLICKNLNSSVLVIWCKQTIHWKSPWCWERLSAEGEEGVRGWDGWMASPMQWIWTRVNSGRWWGRGRPGVLQSKVLQRVRHNCVTKYQQSPADAQNGWRVQDKGFNNPEDEGRDFPLCWGSEYQVLCPEETGRHVLRENSALAVLRSRTPNQDSQPGKDSHIPWSAEADKPPTLTSRDLQGLSWGGCLWQPED